MLDRSSTAAVIIVGIFEFSLQLHANVGMTVGSMLANSINQSTGLFVWQLKARLKHAYN